MKTFTYKNYKDCFFTVGSYAADKKAMAISIENKTDGLISTCTCLLYTSPSPRD